MQPVMSRLATLVAITGMALALALLVACGGDTTSPTATQAPIPTAAPTSPSVTAEPAATQTPAPTLAPTPTRPTAEPTATATQTPATAAALSLDEYLSVCALTEELDLDDDTTYGTLSAAMGALIEGMSPLAPPAEVADWHNKSLEVAKVLKGLVDSQPDDKVVGLEFFAIATELEGLQEALTQAENALPADIRQQMTDAGCIDPEPSSGSGTEPDDHGNGIDTATTVAVEETVQGSLGLYDWDAFAVQVMEGQNYEARLSNYSFGAIGSKEGSLLTVYDSAGAGGCESRRGFRQKSSRMDGRRCRELLRRAWRRRDPRRLHPDRNFCRACSFQGSAQGGDPDFRSAATGHFHS